MRNDRGAGKAPDQATDARVGEPLTLCEGSDEGGETATW